MPASALTRPDEFLDVWSRTAPKYRRRAALLLGLTLVLFAGLCCFAFWLRTGVYGPWSDPEHYRGMMWKSFNPVGANQITLVDFLLFPISVEQVPIQWVIMGLLLATLSSIPILVAILYRFPASVPFALMVGGLAAMPWLGFTVLLGCIIASVRPFRLSFRYASALLGLIPVAIYFISATRLPETVVPLTPYRAKLAAPWVLASLGSCVLCAVALVTAKIINYRPGGIAPLLALMFAIPVLLFHMQVGRDELEYRILEDRVGPGSAYVFVNRNLADEVAKTAANLWANRQAADFNALRAQLMREQFSEAIETEVRQRQVVADRCEAFLARFGTSRYAPNVLYIQGRANDLRIDRALLDTAGLLQFNADWPRPSSRPIWRSLVEQFPDVDLTAHASYQLALLDARDGKLDTAMAYLDALVGRFNERVASTRPSTLDTQTTIFARAAASASLGFDPRSVLIPAQRLRELIRTGRGDPRYKDAPLVAFLRLNPRHPMFALNVAQIIMDYPGSRLEPARALRLAIREPSLRSVIENLQKLVSGYPGRPGQAEIVFCLARAMEDDGQIAASRQCYADVLAQHPESCYASEAQERLAAMSALDAIVRPGSETR